MSNLGGYMYLTRDKLEEDIKRRATIKMDKNRSFDELSIYFLNETLNFCQDNDMTVIFLCPPQHKKCFLDSTYYREYYTKNYNDIQPKYIAFLQNLLYTFFKGLNILYEENIKTRSD